MKSLIGFIKKTFFNTAAIYFLISAVIFITFFAASEMNAASSGAVGLQLYSMLFSFITALCFSVLGAVKKLPSAARYIVGFVLSYAAFYLCFFVLTGNAKNFTALFALSTVYVIAYVLIIALGALSDKLCGNGQKEEDYESVYTNTQE